MNQEIQVAIQRAIEDGTFSVKAVEGIKQLRDEHAALTAGKAALEKQLHMTGEIVKERERELAQARGEVTSLRATAAAVATKETELHKKEIQQAAAIAEGMAVRWCFGDGVQEHHRARNHQQEREHLGPGGKPVRQRRRHHRALHGGRAMSRRELERQMTALEKREEAVLGEHNKIMEAKEALAERLAVLAAFDAANIPANRIRTEQRALEDNLLAMCRDFERRTGAVVYATTFPGQPSDYGRTPRGDKDRMKVHILNIDAPKDES